MGGGGGRCSSFPSVPAWKPATSLLPDPALHLLQLAFPPFLRPSRGDGHELGGRHWRHGHKPLHDDVLEQDGTVVP